MLKLENLTKRYDGYTVFEGLTHEFGPGCVALCEEESTGKSTLLDIIAGVIAPDEGDVWIAGHSIRQSPKQARLGVAYVPRDCLLFPRLTGYELLAMFASQKKAVIDQTALRLCEALGLEAHMDKPFEQMSTGTRRKVYLAAAALGNPAVILADGPSDGLDARARAVMVEQFKAWSQGRLVLFASHDPEFVQACGARVIEVRQLGAA